MEVSIKVLFEVFIGTLEFIKILFFVVLCVAIVVFCIVIVFCVIGVLYCCISDFIKGNFYTKEYKENLACITFKQFLSFYYLCPEKFYLNEEKEYIYLYDDNGNKLKYYFKKIKDLNNYQDFVSSKLKEEERDYNKKESIKSIQTLINIMQKEIDETNQKSQNKIYSEIIKQKEIIERLKVKK